MSRTPTADATALSCPYPGLRPFRADEAVVFFGRDEQVDQLLERLGRQHFLAVVGTSGCGKSSLVIAGLIPALGTGLMGAAGARWAVAVMRPGDRPLWRLAGALLDPAVLGPAWSDLDYPTAQLHSVLERGPLGLSEVLGETPLPGGRNLLLLVDQFEELFRYRREGEGPRDEADAFVALLLATAEQKRVPVYLILTMRSDYLGDCALFTGLPEALNDSQFLTPRLTREQRRRAIEGPSKVLGGRVEPALVGRLLNDMGAEPDQLPLMQHALMRLGSQAEDRVRSDGGAVQDAGEVLLRLEDYEEIGCLSGALNKHAEEAYARLTEDQKKIAEALFRCLSERESGGRDVVRRDIRRPTWLKTVAKVAGSTIDAVIEVVEVFRASDRSFLTPAVPVPLGPDTVLDVSHESLIRRWDRLQQWIEDEAKSAETYDRLKESALLGRDKRTGLLSPPELDFALKWRSEKGPSLPWAQRYGGDFGLAMEFLDASERKHKEDEAECAAKCQKERTNRLIRWAALVTSVGLAGALVLLVWALWERDRVHQALKDLKQTNLKLTVSSEELDRLFWVSRWLLPFNESQRSFPANPQRGVLLAVEAVKAAPDAARAVVKEPASYETVKAAVPASEEAFRNALGQISGQGLAGHGGRVNSVASLPLEEGSLALGGREGRQFATGASDGSVLLWTLGTDDPAVSPVHLGKVAGSANLMRMTPDGRWLVVTSGGSISLWDLKAPGPPRIDLGGEPPLYLKLLGLDGKWLLTFGLPNNMVGKGARLWDLTGKDPREVDQPQAQTD